MLEGNEFKSIGLSIGLILLNVALMGVLAYTPVAGLLNIMFSYAIVGIIFYGALLTGGNYFAERGIKRDDVGVALLGAGILQFAYGSFGAGLLAGLGPQLQGIALAVTAVVTTLIAVLAGAVVYGTDRDFSSWSSYATYLFLGVLGFGFIGTFITPFLLLAFVCALLGFIVYLVHEIWEMRSRPEKVYLNAVGIYVAYMGVFIQVLQIVLRLLSKE
jgi:FtsH-binding integral membrane protein